MGGKGTGTQEKAHGQERVSEEEELVQRSRNFKGEGDQFFARGKHQDALNAYQEALRLSPAESELRAGVHNNRAACLLQLNRPKEAATECNKALDATPGSPKVLVRRARALELADRPKQALNDIENAIKSGYQGEDAKRSRQRLRSAINERRSKAHAQNNPLAQAGEQRQRSGSQTSRPRPQITVRFSLDAADEGPGEDAKEVKVAIDASYATLLSEAQKCLKTGEDSGLRLRYKDNDGDWITICAQQDFQGAVQMALYDFEAKRQQQRQQQRQQEGAGEEAQKSEQQESTQFPPITVRCERVQQSPADQDDLNQKSSSDDVIEIDEWLLEFASLFRHELGLGEEDPVDVHGLGLEKCFSAVDRILQHEKADELLDQACSRFQEAAAHATFNMGNVEMCRMRKNIQTKYAASSADSPSDTALEKAAQNELGLCTDLYNKAMQHYERSLEIQPSFTETYIGQAHHASERGRLLHLAAQHKKGKQADDLRRQSQEAFSLAIEKAKQAVECSPDPSSEGEAGQNAASEEEATSSHSDLLPLKHQALIAWGQVLLERSTVNYHLNNDWQPDFDEARSKFSEASLSEKDMEQRLRQHPAHSPSAFLEAS